MSYPYSAPFDEKPVEKLSIKRALGIILSNWYYILGSVILTVILANLYIRSQPQKYKLRASLMFKSQGIESAYKSEQFMKEMGLFAGSAEIEDKIGMLTSSSLLEEAIQGLPIGISYFQKESFFQFPVDGNKLPVKIVVDSSHLQLVDLVFDLRPLTNGKFLLQASGEHIPVYDIQKDEIIDFLPEVEIDSELAPDEIFETEFMKFRLITSQPSTATHTFRFRLHSLYDLVNETKKKLSIKAISAESNIIELSSSGSLISLEKELLNQLIIAYQKSELEQKTKQAQKALAFIDKEIKGVADSLGRAENLLETYRSSNEVIDVSTSSSTLTTQLVRQEEEKADMELKLRYYRYLKAQVEEGVEQGNIVAPFPEDVQNPVLTNLLIELAKQKTELAGLEMSASKINPKRESLEFQLQHTQHSLNQNIGNLIESTLLRINGLDEKIGVVQSKIRRLPKNEKEINKLNRQFLAIDNLYNYLSEKKAEASIALGNTSDDILVIDRPRLASNKPVSPNKMLIYLMSLILGAGIPLCLIVGRMLINENISTIEDIKNFTKIPYLGAIVRNDTDNNLLLETNAFSKLAESFRRVRVHLSYMTTDTPKQLIAVTSTKSGEGKSFFSANMSSILAQSGKKTILIDMDLRLPSQLEYFDSHANPGMTGFLAGGASLEQIIQPTSISGLEYIPAGMPHYNPVDLFDSGKMLMFLNRLRQDYTHIILDMPPIGATSDYFMIKSMLDYTIYLVRQNVSQINDLEFVNHLFEEEKIKDIGIVVNDVNKKGYFAYGDYGLSSTENAYDDIYMKKSFQASKQKKSLLMRMLP